MTSITSYGFEPKRKVPTITTDLNLSHVHHIKYIYIYIYIYVIFFNVCMYERLGREAGVKLECEVTTPNSHRIFPRSQKL